MINHFFVDYPQRICDLAVATSLVFGLEEIGLEPKDLLDPSNIGTFRPLYDAYLDLTSEHLDAAVDYIRMIPERQFRLKAACMLPVLIGQRTVTLLREGNILDSDEKSKSPVMR